jgi:hypothetical protein
MIKEGDISFLEQLTGTLESSFKEFKKAHYKKDSENFNNIKKTIIEIQKKILEVFEIAA